MPRHEALREQYRTSPYLQRLSPTDLLQRMKDLVANIVELDAEGKASLRPFDADDDLGIKFTHVLEEYRRRGESYQTPELSRDLQFPRPRTPRAMAAIRLGAARGPGFSPGLVKYGQSSWLQDFVGIGRLRISPASYYASDPFLNLARRDSELEISAFASDGPPQRFIMDGRELIVPNANNSEVLAATGTDYYVACFSAAYDFRLFDDFDADACVIVNGHAHFERLVVDAVKLQLPRWSQQCQRVDYIDPFFTNNHTPDPYTSKHMRFAYQREYRFIWIPPDVRPPGTLVKLQIEVGNLAGCAELIELGV